MVTLRLSNATRSLGEIKPALVIAGACVWHGHGTPSPQQIPATRSTPRSQGAVRGTLCGRQQRLHLG